MVSSFLYEGAILETTACDNSVEFRPLREIANTVTIMQNKLVQETTGKCIRKAVLREPENILSASDEIFILFNSDCIL